MDQANGVRFHRVTTMPDDGPDQRPPLHELVPFATLKASFIVMNSLVVSGLTLMLLDALLATNSDKLLVALQMLIGECWSGSATSQKSRRWTISLRKPGLCLKLFIRKNWRQKSDWKDKKGVQTKNGLDTISKIISLIKLGGIFLKLVH